VAFPQEEMMDELNWEELRHSTSHVMAEAVLGMFPGAKFAIGPSIEDGFYYDFDLPRSLTPEDLEQIEARMKGIIKGDHPFVRREIPRQEALEQFSDQPYKLELIQEMGEQETISTYTSGKFTDLCRGPHVERTGRIDPRAFKLLSVAGAYWRGDEARLMLQRIYGTVWPTKQELQAYLQRLEEMEKRDHRRLMRELDLMSLHEEAGAGLAHWHPMGGRIRRVIEEYWYRRHYEGGYEIVYSPHIGKAQLWETSGHLDFFREGMYSPMDIEGLEYFIKPMNCPFHNLMYRTRTRSYRELPLRWAELGTVYRYERSGVLHGLLRVRGFTQDDAHIFCTPDQIEEEITEVLRFSLGIWRDFGFEDIEVFLSTRPEKAVGELERWEQATEALRRAIEAQGLSYEVDEGAGVFYGPKIDLKIRDAMGRQWQMTTIQFDFNEPERFDMTYVGPDGQPHRPYMVHRALLGALERFFGILIEHYGGAFPVWLAPIQAIMIPIADRHNAYAHQVAQELRAAGLRVGVDDSDDRMGAKIRNAQIQKIPYMLVVGDREMGEGTVSVRLRTEENLGPQRPADLVARALDVISAKTGI
jgi:threonyl-tRNA synthetase